MFKRFWTSASEGCYDWLQPVCSQSGVEVVELDSVGVRHSGEGGKVAWFGGEGDGDSRLD